MDLHIFANIDFDPIEFNVKNPEDPIRILSITKNSKLNYNAHDLDHCPGLGPWLNHNTDIDHEHANDPHFEPYH